MTPNELRRKALLARKARLEPTPTRVKQVAVGQRNRARYPDTRRREAQP